MLLMNDICTSFAYEILSFAWLLMNYYKYLGLFNSIYYVPWHAIKGANKKIFPAVKSKMCVTWKETGKPWCEYYHQPDKWLFFSDIVGQFHMFSKHLDPGGQGINQTRTIMIFYYGHLCLYPAQPSIWHKKIKVVHKSIYISL